MRWTVWASVVMVVGSGASGCKCARKSDGSPSVAATGGGRAAATTPASHEGERPPKPRAQPNVAPPKLPKLNAQAAHVDPRAAGHEPTDYPCGTVWTGEEDIPLECESAMDEHNWGPPAVPLIPYEMLRAPKASLPLTVDHRLDGFEGRTLRQGKAGACTAFSLTSQVNHALGLWTGAPGDVSVMEVWARYHLPHGAKALLANVGRTVANDADWPYDQNRARVWQNCHAGAACLSDDERKKLDDLDHHGVVAIEQIERLPNDDSLLDVIQAKLAAGRDVGTGGKLTNPFRPVGDLGARYVPDSNQVGRGAHAFSIVGYTHVDTERYFLVKNSWGEKWGDKGYAWIHEKTLRKIINGAYVVVVDPVAGVGLRRHRRNRAWVAACGASEAPDSVDGACKPMCADGGPRHGGYCGTTDDCTKGFVNVSGECVLAAPRSKGTEPKTRIAWSCAPSGCVYTLPKGVEGCATDRCQKSCPAPDFRLGSGKGGPLCLE
jgi:hypothetical protein